MPMRIRYLLLLLAAIMASPPSVSALPEGSRPAMMPQTGPTALPVQASPGGDIKAMAGQAMDLMDAGRLNEANAALDQAIQANRARGRRGAPFEQFLLSLKAQLLLKAGQYDAAETMLKQLIASTEKTEGRDGDLTTSLFSMLGELYLNQARFQEAEAYLVRAAELSEKHLGKDSPSTAERLNSLAVLYLKTGQPKQAVPILERILVIFRAHANEPGADLAIGATLLNLGGAYQNSLDYPKALDTFKQADQADRDRLGPDHPSTLLVESNIAVLYNLMGRPDDALPLLTHVMTVTRERFGNDNPQTAHVANNLGWTELGRHDFAHAYADLHDAFAIYVANRDLQKRGPNARGVAVDEREVGRTILGLMSAARALSGSDPARAAALTDEAFQAAQQVHRLKAAQALALTTARFSVGDGPLAALIREEQDLSDQRAQGEAWLDASVTQPSEQRNAAQEDGVRQQLDQIAARIEAISGEISQKFPSYQALADPKPLSVSEAQQLLHGNDALVLVAPFGGANGEASFTFVVTKSEARWMSSPTGQTRLTEMVQHLRCGLDIGAWDSKDSAALCGRLTGVAAPSPGEELPFDVGVAHELFDTLFGDLAPLVAGKTLLVVAPDPLASLPFQVLVTEAPVKARPSGKEYSDVAWLGRSNGIAVLPSAAGLRGSRDARSTTNAPEPYIGFGDPTLVGNLDCGLAAVPAACPVLTRVADATSAAPQSVMRRPSLVSRGTLRIDAVPHAPTGLADVDEVRSLCPLPETSLELHCVAASVRSTDSSVRTGDRATVPAVHAEKLDQYRIIHFATHGLLAGDIAADNGVAEPALVLTPPQTAEPGNDGLLRASDIATLKLNADWVVLSACNTAAGSSLGGEAMSGLASAFFYAGARALLVSHWPVDSTAAVLLTTSAFSEMAHDPSIGRADAMRDAMTALMDDPSGMFAHPSIWAPFAVVGESGPTRL